MMTLLNEVIPNWWYFDGKSGTLYCEVEQDDHIGFHKESARLIPSEIYEGAWVGRGPSEQNFVLWKDKELSTANPLVAQVEDWSLRGMLNDEQVHSWTVGLYAALKQHVCWRGEDDIYGVRLFGNYLEGGHFVDDLRLVLPLASGHTLAIGTDNRWFFLYNEPLDQFIFDKEERECQKAQAQAISSTLRTERYTERVLKKLADCDSLTSRLEQWLRGKTERRLERITEKAKAAKSRAIRKASLSADRLL